MLSGNGVTARGTVWIVVAPVTLALALAAGCSASSPGGVGAVGGSSSGGSSSGSSSGGSSSDAGASSGSGGAATCVEDAGVSASGATQWADGTSQAATVTIPAGTTVVIAPGATVTMGASAGILVYGTLVASSACGAHATLAWPSGAAPTASVTVAAGGTLRLDGVDISGAYSALNVTGGTAEYDRGTIDGATYPFFVGAGATLSTTGASVVRSRGNASIGGSLVASGLDYDSNGYSGIVAGDSATLDIRNSKLHGAGPTTDMVISGGSVGATVHVANTEIYEVHCAFHFEPVKTFDITYTDMHDNAFGFMLYGSGSAGGTMSYSNLDATNGYPFLPAATNGPITFDHSYIPAGSSSPPVTITNAASSPVAGAGPM